MTGKGVRLPTWKVGAIIVPTPEWISDDVDDSVKKAYVKQFEPAPTPPVVVRPTAIVNIVKSDGKS